jgi:hypothetical protein
MTSRIHHSFHWVGVVLGAPALFWAGYVAAEADFCSAGLTFCIAVALYAAARAVGWVLDGFMGPDPRA